MQLAMSPTREKFPLSPRKILKKTLPRALGWGLLFVPAEIGLTVTFLFGQNDDGSPLLSAGLFVGLLVLVAFVYIVIITSTYLYQRWYFAAYYYDLETHYLVIRKGPITPHEITIPYERLQDVYVDQDLFDRILGLYDVHLSSATVSSGMEAHIDGLAQEAADGLRDVLLHTIKERISRAQAPDAPSAPSAET